jgi:capsular polysaccharide biosynthesis protein
MLGSILSKTIESCGDSYIDAFWFELKVSQKVAEYLYNKGFEIVYLENHSINNQIKICSSAEYIIAMVGSNLVVPMLATNKTKIISIHTSVREEYGIYHFQYGRSDGIIKSIYIDEDSNDIINYFETSKNYLIREAIDS